MNMWDKLKTGNHRISSEDKNILSNLKFIKKSLRCFLQCENWGHTYRDYAEQHFFSQKLLSSQNFS